MKCGFIYAITNKINGKMYIGKTTKKSFDERYGGDIRNTHNTHLRNSIEYYGIENFKIDECLCECDSEEELNEAEKFYIDYFNTANPEHGYNKTLGGDGVIPNEETRKKISEAHKGEKNPMYGKHLSDEHKKKLSESRKGEKHPLYNKHLSEEIKKKLSESMKKAYENPEYKKKLSESMKKAYENPELKKKVSESIKKAYENPEYKKKLSGTNNYRAKPIVQLDKQGNFIRKWDYIKQAKKELNIGNISNCCRGVCKSAGGYIWMYEEDFISSTTIEPVVPDINTHI